MKPRFPLFVLAVLIAHASMAAPPVVSGVTASQRPGTKLVDIYYNLSDSDGDSQLVEVMVSGDGGLTYTIPCVTLSGAVGAGVSTGNGKHIVWNAGQDWAGNFVDSTKVRVTAHDGTTPPAPPGMVYIEPGPFQMGDNFVEGGTEERPVHNVQVDGFFMDKYEVYRELWEQVKSWGNANGYSISGGSFQGNQHPVQSLSWYNAVKWCNARSQLEGKTPCYYTDTALTTIYKTGDVAITSNMVKWDANGYRLPTEAEWEKAARDGMTGKRYPWGDSITGSNANYASSGDPFETGSTPYTSTVGYYPANGYGLYDMAGNVVEWVWDFYNTTYYGSPDSLNNPRGGTGTYRVMRGGAWNFSTNLLRCAYRDRNTPTSAVNYIGFRCVRGL